MLEYLRIKGLALIDDMELEFGRGMNVLTGETGAGKSFILKAISFVLGDKLSVDLIRPGCSMAQVEALFHSKTSGGEEKETILRRTISASTGRSHFFVNDALSSQDAVREMRPDLLFHISQHGQQRLLQPSFQSALIDSFLETPSLLERRSSLLGELKRVSEKRRSLREQIMALTEKRELLEMQQSEIDKVSPEEGEEERLERARSELKQWKASCGSYAKSLELLSGTEKPGIIDMMCELRHSVHALTVQDPSFQDFLDSIDSFRNVLDGLEGRLRKQPSRPPGSDADAVESRLFQLAQLKRKLRRSIPEILALKQEIRSTLSFLDSCSLDLQQMSRKEWLLSQELHGTLELLNAQRRLAAQRFCTALEEQLKGLGFNEHLRVIPLEGRSELWPALHGKKSTLPPCEELRETLLWSPNPGQHAHPLDKIASGGELSRFMLAVVGIQRFSDDSTLVFDEIDSGIGGMTLNRVSERLCALSAKRQTLVITHWPQLAAKADQHFRVSKEIHGGQTYTFCKKLSAGERQAELKRMAGLGDDGGTPPISSSCQA
ncbi:MAG: DNA repair protein RecN [Desulfovibrio sp.]